MGKFSKSLISCLLLLNTVSCNEDKVTLLETSCTKNEEYYTNEKNTSLTLSTQNWFLKENSFGGIDGGVQIAGSIVGDSANILTFGDGLFTNIPISLTSDNMFNQNVGLFFTTEPLSEMDVVLETEIQVYNQNDTLKVKLSSCLLENIQL